MREGAGWIGAVMLIQSTLGNLVPGLDFGRMLGSSAYGLVQGADERDLRDLGLGQRLRHTR
jgi:hypothetical protein